MDLHLGYLILSLEFGLGSLDSELVLYSPDLESGFRTWSLEYTVGVWNTHLEFGIRTWSLEYALGNPESVLRV